MFVYVCVNLAVAWFFCETPQHCSSWPDHWSWHWTDLLLQSFHRWKQLEPPGHAHSAGACADFGADHGSRAVQCNFLASWMGGGQRPSKWKAILFQSKHTGDKVGTSLKCWKKIEGRSTLALRVVGNIMSHYSEIVKGNTEIGTFSSLFAFLSDQVLLPVQCDICDISRECCGGSVCRCLCRRRPELMLSGKMRDTPWKCRSGYNAPNDGLIGKDMLAMVGMSIPSAT